MISRRSLLTCLMVSEEFDVENTDTPFYEHFHTLAIPVAALISLPAEGVTCTTSTVDQGSYDIAGFAKFLASSKIPESTLKAHSHDVLITQEQLKRIASGEAKVEIKVISKSGNYVHNFLVTAPRSAIVKVQKAQDKKKKV